MPAIVTHPRRLGCLQVTTVPTTVREVETVGTAQVVHVWTTHTWETPCGQRLELDASMPAIRRTPAGEVDPNRREALRLMGQWSEVAFYIYEPIMPAGVPPLPSGGAPR